MPNSNRQKLKCDKMPNRQSNLRDKMPNATKILSNSKIDFYFSSNAYHFDKTSYKNAFCTRR